VLDLDPAEGLQHLLGLPVEGLQVRGLDPVLAGDLADQEFGVAADGQS